MIKQCLTQLYIVPLESRVEFIGASSSNKNEKMAVYPCRAAIHSDLWITGALPGIVLSIRGMDSSVLRMMLWKESFTRSILPSAHASSTVGICCTKDNDVGGCEICSVEMVSAIRVGFRWRGQCTVNTRHEKGKRQLHNDLRAYICPGWASEQKTYP